MRDGCGLNFQNVHKCKCKKACTWTTMEPHLTNKFLDVYFKK